MPDYNQFINGIGVSKFDQTGFDSMVNCDAHTELGSLKCPLVLYADTTSGVPDEPCVQTTSSTGTQYFFSTTSTKRWKRNTAGEYSSITANTQSGGHNGAQYYNGKIWYWTASKLGHFDEDTEASIDDVHGTFSNSKAYAACEENLTLFITDGKYVASVNSSLTFTANALDIPAQFIGRCIIPDKYTNILIGTIVSTTVKQCRAFIWDTYSDSFSLSNELQENGINCFINTDEYILAQCGTNGRLYQWSGGQFSLFEKELRDETTAIGWQKSVVLNGRPLLAVGTKIYTIHRKVAGQPRAVVQQYTATDTITSIDVQNNNLIVSISDGVNLRHATNRATGAIDTPQVQGSFNNVIVSYESYPEGIGISTKTNGAGWVAQTPVIDTINKKVYFDGGLADCQFMQARITMTSSGSSTPIITNISII